VRLCLTHSASLIVPLKHCTSGLFARYSIPKGVTVVAYLGEYYERTNWDARTRGFYSWEFGAENQSDGRVLDAFEYRNVRRTRERTVC
jgi:hypothetical protein